MSFEEVIGLEEAKKSLNEAVIMPLLYPQLFCGKYFESSKILCILAYVGFTYAFCFNLNILVFNILLSKDCIVFSKSKCNAIGYHYAAQHFKFVSGTDIATQE